MKRLLGFFLVTVFVLVFSGVAQAQAATEEADKPFCRTLLLPQAGILPGTLETLEILSAPAYSSDRVIYQLDPSFEKRKIKDKCQIRWFVVPHQDGETLEKVLERFLASVNDDKRTAVILRIEYVVTANPTDLGFIFIYTYPSNIF